MGFLWERCELPTHPLVRLVWGGWVGGAGSSGRRCGVGEGRDAGESGRWEGESQGCG